MTIPPIPLSTTDHNREVPGLRYIYPVMSRRAGGLSIGINVNTNNACNWRCVYCQIPNLARGAAPEVDFTLLADELNRFLTSVKTGEFFNQFQIDPDKRAIKDIAISGNGEPTSVKDFLTLVQTVGDVATTHDLLPMIKLILITNGSLIHQPNVQAGLKHWHTLGGEVWFKLDSGTAAGRQRINNIHQSNAKTVRNLRLCAELCTTKIQTCLLDYAGHGWSTAEQNAYLNILNELKNLPNLKEVLLYTLARTSYQPEAEQIKALPLSAMQQVATAIRNLGFNVSTYG